MNPCNKMAASPLACVTLDGNADAVEFCCTPPFCHILAAATYTLQEGPQPSRAGSLALFSVEQQDHQLHKHCHLHTSGIFDIKWRPNPPHGVPFLAQASADGTLSLYKMRVQDTFNLSELLRENIGCAMCLSLDWDPHSCKQIAISHSDGSLSVLDVGESQMEICHSSSAHGFEAWSVAYDSWRSNVIYSGGDDCHFCCWDLRQGFSQPIFREKKIHQMGVCSIQTNPQWDNVLATGSYDENLRLWDLRMLEKPKLEKALGLGGGVWKLKWNPFDKRLLVAACMHNGFVIVKVQEDNISIDMEYKEHKSLAYGADWFKAPAMSMSTSAADHSVANFNDSTSRSTNEQSIADRSLNEFAMENGGYSHFLLATCSFYDRSLHIWKHDFC